MNEFISKLPEFVSNNLIMCVAWVALLVTLIFMSVKSITSVVKLISYTEVTKLLNQHNGVVVDTRSQDEYRKGHIVGSIHVLPSDIKSGKTPNIDKYKDVPIIVVDATGLSSESLATSLYKLGFKQAYALKDGITAWKAANLPLVKH